MYVSRDGVKLFYQVTGGSGPDVFLLPQCQPVTYSRQWKNQIPYLSRYFRVATMDPRGNGRSDRPPTGYDLLSRLCSHHHRNAISSIDCRRRSRRRGNRSFEGLGFVVSSNMARPAAAVRAHRGRGGEGIAAEVAGLRASRSIARLDGRDIPLGGDIVRLDGHCDRGRCQFREGSRAVDAAPAR